MAEIRKFDFSKTYEEVEIAGEVYQIEFNDESMQRYLSKIDEFHSESKRLNAIDSSKLSSKEQLEVFAEIQESVKDMVETIIGQDTYTPLYEKSGQSVMGMMDLAIYLADKIGERNKKDQADRKKKYVTKKKKNVPANKNS